MWLTSIILISLLHAGWCQYGSTCKDGKCQDGMVCIEEICKCNDTTHEIYIHFEDRQNSSLAKCREKETCVDASDCKRGRCLKKGDSSSGRCTCVEDEVFIKQKNGEVNGCWKNRNKNLSESCLSIGANCDVDKKLLCYAGTCRCQSQEVFYRNRCHTLQEYSTLTGLDGYIPQENMYCTSEFECISETGANLTCSSNICGRRSAASSYAASAYLFLIVLSIGLTSCTSHILVF